MISAMQLILCVDRNFSVPLEILMDTKISKHSEYDCKRAKESVERFVKRFGESYRLLAYHAALPLVLTPELLNYLRNKFLRGEVPWVAEVDLLLSDLCSQVGYELYAMDTAVRAYLIDEMFKEEWGPERMHEVSRLLIQYLHHLSRTNPFIGEHELQAQQWAAMVYLEDQRENVVRQIAKTFQNCLTSSSATFDAVSLSRVVQALAPQLKEHPALVKYALFTSSLSTDFNSIEDKTAQFRKMFGQEHDVTIAGVSLPGPERLFEELTGYEEKKTTYVRRKREYGVLYILIVFQQREQGSYIRDVLENEFFKHGLDVFIDLARNEAEAKKRLEARKYHLVITYLHIPADSKSPVREEERRGIALLQSLEKDRIEIPSVLISSWIDEYLVKTINDLYYCKLVAIGSKEWEEDLVKASQKALQKALQEFEAEQQKEEEKWVNIDIFLDLSRRHWSYTVEGVGFHFQSRDVLNIDADKIRALVVPSRHIQYTPDWERKLRHIGETLWKEIFANNPRFSAAFYQLIGEAGGVENARIRFVTDKMVSPIALEAVNYEHDYWMLRAPIYRGLPGPHRLYPPLFSDRETQEGSINCLIVEANVEGLVSVAKKELVRLHYIEQEASFLEEFVTDNKAELGVAKVQRIPETDGETCTKELVEEWLTKKGPWHLVHYAGHSFFDGNNKVGYVFFPANGEPAAVDIEQFSLWLRAARTRFIYLSACHTSEDDFIFEVARNGIPAVMGFRWDVEDDKAAKFAECFYMHLFKGKSLEHALLEARRDSYSYWEKNIIWASPILVLG
ncbi:MAG: CHAT domain-containing protein [Candidatus Hodarchaeota archaeon]